MEWKLGPDRERTKISEELRHHYLLLVEEKMREGLPRAEAEAAARRQLGNVTAVSQELREMRWSLRLEQFWQDLRFGARLLLKDRGFTAVAVLTLALGIGANTAIFSVFNAVLLSPLPYPHPEQLVMIWEQSKANPRERYIASAPNYLDWRAQSTSFQSMAAFERQGINVSDTQAPEQVGAARVTASAFAVLGIPAALGRTFLEEEDKLGNDTVVVLGHRLWQQRYGGDPAIVGRSIRVNGKPTTVIGVMPPEFVFPVPQVQAWVPIAFNQTDESRDAHSFTVFARLKAGVTPEQAEAEIKTVAARIEQQYPNEAAGETASVMPTSEWVVGTMRPVLASLLGAVGLVLLIACVNVSNLLLARNSAREREFAVRHALGAARGRVVRQLLSESLLLATLGGMAGLLIARWGAELLWRLVPYSIRGFIPFRHTESIALDTTVLAFTAAASLLVAVLFGLVPALRSSRVDVEQALKESGSRGSSRRSGRLSPALVSAEMALGVVVLSGAFLMLQSVRQLLMVDAGFQAKNVVAAEILLPQADFYGKPERRDFCRDARTELAKVSGVAGSSAVSHPPLAGIAGRGFTIEGRPEPAPNATPGASYAVVCPEYFRLMGIPLLRGRDFHDNDSVDALPVAIISQATVKEYWPNEDPVGRRIRLANEWVTIVGVVGDIRHYGLREAPPEMLYRPYSQAVWPSMTLLAKADSDPAALMRAIAKAGGQIDPEQPVAELYLAEELITDSIAMPRFVTWLLTIFAGLATLLSSLGVYALISYATERRTREIGVRVALGAQRSQILTLFLQQGLRWSTLGVAGGTLIALLANRTLSSLLYAVEPTDATTLGITAATLLAASAVATALPAQRATKVEPTVALRYE